LDRDHFGARTQQRSENWSEPFRFPFGSETITRSKVANDFTGSKTASAFTFTEK